MRGKTVVITGASSGIGRACARALATRGADVIFSARDTTRATETQRELSAAGAGRSQAVLADFESLAAVDAFADAVSAAAPQIDVLVLNAGVILSERRHTVDGLEATFQVNHVAPFRLVQRFLPLLLKAAPARIVVVASDAHQAIRRRPTFATWADPRPYLGFPVYARSKLANLLFMRMLAKRLDPQRVVVNAVHPGVVRTGFGRDGDTSGLFGAGVKFFAPLMRSPERGAETLLFLATDARAASLHGGYFADGKPRRMSAIASEDGLGEELWAETEAFLARHHGAGRTQGSSRL